MLDCHAAFPLNYYVIHVKYLKKNTYTHLEKVKRIVKNSLIQLKVSVFSIRRSLDYEPNRYSWTVLLTV